MQVARVAVFSLHKRASRDYIKRVGAKSPQVRACEVAAELRYDLPATYKHHKCVISLLCALGLRNTHINIACVPAPFCF